MQSRLMTDPRHYESHLHLISEREKEYEGLFRSGAFSPLLLQQVLGTFALLLIPLVIRYKSAFHSKLVRYGFHAIITALSFYTIREVRFTGPGNGYSTGLITTWFYIWSSTILLANDVQKDFKRIEKEYVYVGTKNTHGGDVTNQNGSSKAINHTNNRHLKLRTSGTSPRSDSSHSNEGELRQVYRWRPFPQQLSHRIDWALDLIFNFRGPNWNWRLRSLPPLPEAVIRDTENQAIYVNKQEKSKLTTCSPSARLRYAFYAFLRDYLILDLLKVVLMRDPYFWGFVDNPPASPPWPFHILAFSPVLVRAYRLILSVTAVLFALDIITSLNPLFFLGLSLAFPNFSRAITHQPLDEACLYPESFGSAVAVLDRGLIGAWNIWWHQLFRFGFSECSRFILDLLLPRDDDQTEGKNIDNSSKNRKYTSFYKLTRRILQVMLVFSLSGLVHAMGSYTTFADSRPWNAFLFFFLQGVGVLIQTLFEIALIPKLAALTTFTPPRWLVRTINLVLIVLWFYFTGPLIADDFSRSGLWMFEPLPISPLRGGLGLGVEGDQWFCWKGSWFEWRSGDSWWQSGIRLV